MKFETSKPSHAWLWQRIQALLLPTPGTVGSPALCCLSYFQGESLRSMIWRYLPPQLLCELRLCTQQSGGGWWACRGAPWTCRSWSVSCSSLTQPFTAHSSLGRRVCFTRLSSSSRVLQCLVRHLVGLAEMLLETHVRHTRTPQSKQRHGHVNRVGYHPTGHASPA